MFYKSSFFLFLLVLACGRQSGIDQAAMLVDLDTEEEVLRYIKEVEWPKAYRDQDTVLLDRILGDDFQMVSADGSWSDKAGQMERIKAAPMDNDFFEFEIKRLEVFENGTAIVAGTGHVMHDGQEMNYQSSNVLIKRGEQWKAVLSHVSGISQLESPHNHMANDLPSEGDFSYLIGDWKRSNEAAGKETFEHWAKISYDTYVGLGYTLMAGDTVWKEDILLKREADHWHYEVTGTGDSSATPFKVIKAGKSKFECFNPVNEFPKTIRYTRVSDTLFARISDTDKQIDFTFVRIKS